VKFKQELLGWGGTLAHPSLGIDPKQTLITIGKGVGGMALLGPAGLLAALVNANPADPNPCLTAVEAAKKSGKISDTKKPKPKEDSERRAISP